MGSIFLPVCVTSLFIIKEGFCTRASKSINGRYDGDAGQLQKLDAVKKAVNKHEQEKVIRGRVVDEAGRGNFLRLNIY